MMKSIFHWKNVMDKTTKTFAAVALIGALAVYAKSGGHDNIFTLNPFISSAYAEETAQCKIDQARIDDLKQHAKGYFSKMRFAEKAYSASQFSFKSADDKVMSLADFKGKVLLVNLWAVWCKPCRTEMPELANLEKQLGGDDFSVIAINIDNNSNEKVQAFLQDVGAEQLALYRDQAMASFEDARRAGLAFGLPVTLLLDENNCLLMSYNGAAPWGDADSVALMKAAIKSKKPHAE